MMRWTGFLLAVVCCATNDTRLAAQGAACAQARSIVAEVELRLGDERPDHATLLRKLDTARNLCSSLGDAWKYSACAAKALGDEKQARIYRDRALFNGVTDLACPDETPATKAHPAAAPLGPVRAKHALIIGIGNFKDPRIPRLSFPAKDARDLAALLVDPRYGRFDPARVQVLTDEQATRERVLDGLQRLFNESGGDDMVFLYVSSHGSPQRAETGLGGVGYIVTHDTALDRIWLDGIDYEGFTKKISLLKARRKVVLLDTCYSGQARRPGEKALAIEAAGIAPETARSLLSGEGTYVITSSRADERSYESEELRNGYFTYYLLKALRSEGSPPTLQQVFASLAREVPAAVGRDLGQPQHPQLFPTGTDADLRIGVVPTEPPNPEVMR